MTSQKIEVTNETAMQLLLNIKNALNTLPAYDEQATFMKSGIYQALNGLTEWVIGLQDGGEGDLE